MGSRIDKQPWERRLQFNLINVSYGFALNLTWKGLFGLQSSPAKAKCGANESWCAGRMSCNGLIVRDLVCVWGGD